MTETTLSKRNYFALDSCIRRGGIMSKFKDQDCDSYSLISSPPPT